MTMTVNEIRGHAARLQDRLDLERRRVEHGGYLGNRECNLDLVRALEGRITELLAHCDAVEAAAALVSA